MQKYKLATILLGIILLSLDLSAQDVLSLDVSRVSFTDARKSIYNPSVKLNFEYERNDFFYGVIPRFRHQHFPLLKPVNRKFVHKKFPISPFL